MRQRVDSLSGMEDKILLVDKPVGITSFDVIRKLRTRIGKIKMGHAGTLDPLASGLMIIATGKKTKELSMLLGLPKTYEAEIRFGISTTTGDKEGAIVEQKACPVLSVEVITLTLQSMIGELLLPVPLYSAVKRNGKPLYAYAREGVNVEPPVKSMIIRDAKCLSVNAESAEVWFDVESGTYIRTLAEELGRRLGTVAHLTNLRRLSIGTHHIDEEQVIRL
jgi:tRNA pseudouridine55 synthase